MYLFEEKIFNKDDCESLLNSAKDFKPAGLYYKGSRNSKNLVILPEKRNALSSELNLIKGTIFYEKINSAIRNVGFELASDSLKFQIVKYNVGHFIYKHRHDLDAHMYLTIIVQLNDTSEYEGGDFIYWLKNGEEKRMGRKIGNGMIIGPEVEHEVKIVTKGSRNSFVLFLEYSDLKPIQKQSIL